MARVEQKLEDFGKGQERIEAKLDAFISSADDRYVSQDAFRPVQKIVYGLAGAVFLAVIGAVMALILTHK